MVLFLRDFMFKYFNTILIRYTVNIIFLFVLFLAGCGDGGVPTILTDDVDAGTAAVKTAAISGTAYLPNTVSTERKQSRSAHIVGHDTVFSEATIAIMRMRHDGKLESLGEQYTTVTDANGQFTISDVPEEDNLIIEASKVMQSNETSQTIKLLKIISVTQSDSAAGNIIGLSLDTGSTLSVEAMKQIMKNANSGKLYDALINGANLPRERLQNLELIIDSALNTDQSSNLPIVDMYSIVADGDAAINIQLANLINSSFGETVKTQIQSMSCNGGIRVNVTDGENKPIIEAHVVFTIGGNVQTKTTNSIGEVYFENINQDDSIEIEVSKQGYSLAKATQTISILPAVNIVKIQLEPEKNNQIPISKAGPDQIIALNSNASLDGSSSFDPDEEPISYLWSQTEGSTISLSDTASSQPTFKATILGTYSFSLVVTDNTGASSASDIVAITVRSIDCTTDSDCEDGYDLSYNYCVNPGTVYSYCNVSPMLCNSIIHCDY